MKTEQTESHGVRLPVSYWIKLRSLMQHHGGRKWLEKAIDREVKKVGTSITAADLPAPAEKVDV